VTGAVAALLSCYALFVGSQAASLLMDLTTLNVGTSTESDVEQLTRKYLPFLVSRESNDGVTTTSFSVRNTWLSALRLEPVAFFRASVGVKKGRVCHIGALLFRSMDIYPTFQGSARMVDEYTEYPKQYSREEQYEFPTPVGKPYLKALLDSHASPLSAEACLRLFLPLPYRTRWRMRSLLRLPACRVAGLENGFAGQRIVRHVQAILSEKIEMRFEARLYARLLGFTPGVHAIQAGTTHRSSSVGCRASKEDEILIWIETIKVLASHGSSLSAGCAHTVHKSKCSHHIGLRRQRRFRVKSNGTDGKPTLHPENQQTLFASSNE
jgi:hypothetical protein